MSTYTDYLNTLNIYYDNWIKSATTDILAEISVNVDFRDKARNAILNKKTPISPVILCDLCNEQLVIVKKLVCPKCGTIYPKIFS